MDVDEYDLPEEQEGEYVEIYSKWTILGFATFPTPIFGSVLLILNLIAAGYKKVIWQVIVFTILFVVAENLVLNHFFPMPKVIDPTHINPQLFIIAGLSLVANFIGGSILSFYFFKKYFPEDDYYPKSIASPLIVLVVLILLTGFFR